MKAMLLNRICDLNKEISPLLLSELDIPVPAHDEVLLKVKSCGICHTEIDEIEGRTPPPLFPVISRREDNVPSGNWSAGYTGACVYFLLRKYCANGWDRPSW